MKKLVSLIIGLSSLATLHVFSIPPVDLLFFNVTQQGNTVLLEWETNSEVNNDLFTIERSLDGLTFNEIDTVSGSGTTVTSMSYSLIPGPFTISTIYYYRLRQTDFDASFDTFSMVSIQFVTSINQTTKAPMITNVTVYPNPLSDKGRITIESPAHSEFNVKIFGILGNEVVSGKTKNQEYLIPVGSLKSGMYLYEVSSAKDDVYDSGKFLIDHP